MSYAEPLKEQKKKLEQIGMGLPSYRITMTSLQW